MPQELLPPLAASPDLRVFIAERSAHIRARMVSLLDRCAGVAYVGWAESVGECIAGVRRTNPHGLVLDLQLVDGCALPALRALRSDNPGLRVVVCATWATAQHEAACREAGAERLIDKATEFPELSNIVQAWVRSHGVRPVIH